MNSWVVIPAYNEGRVISEVLTGLVSQASNIVVVDDGSQDDTGARARASGARVIRHALNRGQGAALKTGIDYALARGAECIVTFDADGQHEPENLKAFFGPIERGETDVVLGSRFIEENSVFRKQKSEIPFLRRWLLRLAVVFTRVTTGLRVTDAHNGLRAFSRHAAQTVQIHQDGMAHASEILEEVAKHRLRFIEVPVRIRYTEYSLEKGQKGKDSFKILWDLLVGKITK